MKTMAKNFAEAFYNSKRWVDCRSSYISQRIAIDGGLCERCHNAPGYIVHHKIYLDPTNINDPEISLNHDNLEYLCHECHNDEHVGREAPLCSFDAEGRPCAAT